MSFSKILQNTNKTSVSDRITSIRGPVLQRSIGIEPVDQDNFTQTLTKAQQNVTIRPSSMPTNRWRNRSFLTNRATVRQVAWPWTYSNLSQPLEAAAAKLERSIEAITPLQHILQPLTEAAWKSAGTLSLVDYPHPPGDNGKGIHWIPTVNQTPEVVDRFVDEAVAMGMKWVVFLNEGTDTENNDYLVKKLTKAGIEPIMRVYTPGLVPIEGDLKEMVRHYTKLGVHYFQLYNEPNLMVETGGQFPSVDRYLDLWVPAAQDIIEAGGLPGFGALSPQGEMDDREFLQQALKRLKARGQADMLGHSWLSMHNYTGPRPMNDPDGFLRFQQYNAIIQSVLGRSIPIIGTEGGTHITEHVSEEKQISMVTSAYNYMRQREPYNFAYTYWIIANGHDSAWDEHALFRSDGPTALAQTLKDIASGERT